MHDREQMKDATLIERKLGASSARLHERLAALYHDAARDMGATIPERDRVTAAIRRMLIELLCGSYHDYRSDSVLPKGALVVALRELPLAKRSHVAQSVIDLIAELQGGNFDEDETEGERWRHWILQANTRHRPVLTPHGTDRPQPVTLSPRQHQVFCWLVRYVETYDKAPTQTEIASALEMTTQHVLAVLRQLETKRCVQSIGGVRGWIPTRKP